MIFALLIVNGINNETMLVCGTPPEPPAESGLILFDVPEHICPGLAVTYKCNVGGVNKFLVSINVLNSVSFQKNDKQA